MNLGELKARVRDNLQAETDDLRYTDAKITQTLNEGNRDMVVRSGALVAETTFTTQAYSYQYALPSDCVNILRVFETEDTRKKVWPLSVRKIDAARREWRAQTSTSIEWYFRFSMGVLMVGPRPATGGVEYTIWYTQDPGAASMSAETDQPDVPVRFRDALVEYATGRLMLEGGRGEAVAAQSAKWLKSYEAGVINLKHEIFKSHDKMHVFGQGWADSQQYGVPV